MICNVWVRTWLSAYRALDALCSGFGGTLRCVGRASSTTMRCLAVYWLVRRASCFDWLRFRGKLARSHGAWPRVGLAGLVGLALGGFCIEVDWHVTFPHVHDPLIVRVPASGAGECQVV